MDGTAVAETRVTFVRSSGERVEGPINEVDLDGLERALPVRKISSHPGQRNRPGLFWSVTNRGHVPYESWLELDRLLLADADPEVTWIAAQPMALTGMDGDALRRHVPDLLLARVRGSAARIGDRL